ncbi:L,D-transpeptidase [Nocardioides cheoyonin]|uniref:L,D-transpeptidase n=1 Tax=Nocardioides cheoyonin TaxID=3156615 RepID=UPI0032B5975E
MSLVRRSRRTAPAQARRSGPLIAVALVSAVLLALSGCGASSSSDDQGSAPVGSADDAQGAGETTAPPKPAVTVTSNIARGAHGVAVDKVVKVSAKNGTVEDVAVTTGKGARVAGTVSADRTTWTATQLLEPGTAYTVRATGVDADGKALTTKSRFWTKDLTLDEQTYPSVAPLNGETVGIGMPVIVTFDVPVTDKANFEKHMHVDSKPAQQGSWYWVSDKEAHWRPKTYWKAGTDVSVHVDVNSVAAGGGIFGQEDRDVSFHVGDAHIYKVNTRTDEMKVFSNGKLLRTIPVTTGKPGFTTRSGVKVIIEKFAKHTMNSETIGIGKNNPEYYDMKDVQWAMRMTYSGEFLHAAPWSVYAQGHENVSHGCTGMSTADAYWLYQMTRRGDVVETVGTDRPMEFGNGYGDWNMSFANYKKGSALA